MKELLLKFEIRSAILEVTFVSRAKLIDACLNTFCTQNKKAVDEDTNGETIPQLSHFL
jgi:hypothetical protein